MEKFALYYYTFKKIQDLQGSFFKPEQTAGDTDRNAFINHLFGPSKSDVRIQKVKGSDADKYPCTVIEHEDRIVYLRMENEKTLNAYLKQAGKNGGIPEIKKEPIKHYPYSFILIDFRKDSNLMAIKIEPDAWRSTDTASKLLESSINRMLESQGYDYRISINPITISKDFWDYNKTLVKKKKRKIKKLTIRFTGGGFSPEVEQVVSKSSFLRNLTRDIWGVSGGKIEYNDPLGEKVFTERSKDLKGIIEVIGSSLTDPGFGLSLVYEDGLEVSCGKDMRLDFGMDTETEINLFVDDIFGRKVELWLDKAKKHIEEYKHEQIVEPRRERKRAKGIQNPSAVLDFTQST